MDSFTSIKISNLQHASIIFCRLPLYPCHFYLIFQTCIIALLFLMFLSFLLLVLLSLEESSKEALPWRTYQREFDLWRVLSQGVCLNSRIAPCMIKCLHNNYYRKHHWRSSSPTLASVWIWAMQIFASWMASTMTLFNSPIC